MKACIVVIIILLSMVISECVSPNRCLPAAPAAPARLHYIESIGGGVYHIHLILVDGKEYIVNQGGGIIEHTSN